jgi:hypothetical protein
MNKIIATFSGVIVLAAGLSTASQANAQDKGEKYACYEPTNTVVFLQPASIQPAIPIIQFTLNTAKDQGWDNLTRCRIVASKFDRAYREGRLKYSLVSRLPIRPGVSLPVLCGLRSSSETCNRDSMLYTILNPVTNPKSVIEEVFGINRSATSPAVIEGGTKCRSEVFVGTNENGESFVEMNQVILYKSTQYSANNCK